MGSIKSTKAILKVWKVAIIVKYSMCNRSCVIGDNNVGLVEKKECCKDLVECSVYKYYY
jgi:hypothetical protein